VSARARALLIVVVVGAGLGLAAATLYARQTHFPLPRSTERLLYLQSGKTADRLMLTYDALAADVYWIRTIQHYGTDRKSSRTTDRFSLLYPLLDLTTTLDPHFNVAYRFGWIFLAMAPPDGPGRTDLAIKLLEKGLAANPDRWQYAYDAGFVHYWYSGDFQEAARWFARAATMPEAPRWIAPLAATTKIQGGDRQEARRMLQSLAGSEERYIRDAARRGLAQLETLDLIDVLQQFVDAFQAQHGRYPADWNEIARSAAERRIGIRVPPLDPSGTPLVYDAETHEVTIGPTSPLAPLPRSMTRQGRR
jgi:tetratricopeptide (TPR) repeat protein